MNQVIKAVRTIVPYAGQDIEVLELPSGELRLSYTQVGEIVSKPRNSVLRFLSGKSPEALPLKDLLVLHVASDDMRTPAKTLDFAQASLYWTYQARIGNEQAIALGAAAIADGIRRSWEQLQGKTPTVQEVSQRVEIQAKKNLSFIQGIDWDYNHAVDGVTRRKLARQGITDTPVRFKTRTGFNAILEFAKANNLTIDGGLTQEEAEVIATQYTSEIEAFSLRS